MKKQISFVRSRFVLACALLATAGSLGVASRAYAKEDNSSSGSWAAWLYDLLKPHVTEVVVCNPRKMALLILPNHER